MMWRKGDVRLEISLVVPGRYLTLAKIHVPDRERLCMDAAPQGYRVRVCRGRLRRRRCRLQRSIHRVAQPEQHQP